MFSTARASCLCINSVVGFYIYNVLNIFHWGREGGGSFFFVVFLFFFT